MTSPNQLNRTIDACLRAGLPILDEKRCACALRGRLVVLASPDGLRVLWPYDGGCPLHEPLDREEPRPTGRPANSRSRSQAAPEVWAVRKAGIP